MTKIEFLGAKLETDSVLTKEELESLLISLTSAYTTAVIAMNTATNSSDDPTSNISMN